MMATRWLARTAAAACLFGCAVATAAPKIEPGRGELLYSNHCIACHNERVHWRDQRLAKDWQSLLHQVRRWQANTGLTWEDEDIRAVARYLNVRYYQFPATAVGQTVSSGNRSK
ncbi:c-type cytochrome [Lacisediminimonas profundi]|uniref:c-type cytochrome n=1 Tax=Lacisediminimonas profundi TaxID=2603856 RepID=UPI001F500313|nr:cytochrome c [Lacisediminimonas profundi]